MVVYGAFLAVVGPKAAITSCIHARITQASGPYRHILSTHPELRRFLSWLQPGTTLEFSKMKNTVTRRLTCHISIIRDSESWKGRSTKRFRKPHVSVWGKHGRFRSHSLKINKLRVWYSLVLAKLQKWKPGKSFGKPFPKNKARVLFLKRIIQNSAEVVGKVWPEKWAKGIFEVNFPSPRPLFFDWRQIFGSNPTLEPAVAFKQDYKQQHIRVYQKGRPGWAANAGLENFAKK